MPKILEHPLSDAERQSLTNLNLALLVTKSQLVDLQHQHEQLLSQIESAQRESALAEARLQTAIAVIAQLNGFEGNVHLSPDGSKILSL